jgi:hypothetical protein
MSYYMMDYSMTNPGTPGWQFAPVPGWGANPLAAGPRRVGVGQDNGTRTAADIEGRYAQTSWGMVAAVGAGALLFGVFLGYVAGKRAQKKLTANRRRRLGSHANQRKFDIKEGKVKRRRAPAKRKTTARPGAAKGKQPLTAVCLVANPRWSARYKNQLPDSAFLYVAPGGRKIRTKRGTFTVPRSKRKLPVRDLQGRLNKSHLANAIARLGQKKTKVPGKRKLQERAQRMYAREFGYAKAPRRALPRAA